MGKSYDGVDSLQTFFKNLILCVCYTFQGIYMSLAPWNTYDCKEAFVHPVSP